MRDFPGLFEQERRKKTAAEHLERARRAVTAVEPAAGDTWSAQADRLRAAADEAEAAARHLRELCGWLDAASSAADDGLLD